MPAIFNMRMFWFLQWRRLGGSIFHVDRIVHGVWDHVLVSGYVSGYVGGRGRGGVMLKWMHIYMYVMMRGIE
jgi:hypothetical protein